MLGMLLGRLRGFLSSDLPLDLIEQQQGIVGIAHIGIGRHAD